MNLNREENYKYRKTALTILAKALDDICPKFEGEGHDTRNQLIKERVMVFKANERELDKEWNALEKEASYELKEFNKARNLITRKIEKTLKTKRIEARVKELNHKKDVRVTYLIQKEKTTRQSLLSQLETLDKNSKKYIQMSKKLDAFTTSTNDKIKKTYDRYDLIINNLKNSDNSDKVIERLKHSKEVWNRKFERLKRKFNERETIYENKRFELDEIRLSIQSFEEEYERISHWCMMAGVTVKTCYTAAKERMSLIGRESEVIDRILLKIKEEGEDNPL